jgi:catalase (peroxidase I)
MSDFVIETLPACEDLLVLSNGTLLMGQGSKIFSFTEGKHDWWKEEADLGKTFTKISRMALNAQGNKIVFVDIVSAP